MALIKSSRLHDLLFHGNAPSPFVSIHSSRDWRDRLIERHPNLLRDANGRPVGRPQVGDGWAEVVARAIDRIEAVAGNSAVVRISEIKEKYGTLRIYTNVVRDPIMAAVVEEAVALAEARSECTCDVCGALGVLYEQGDVLATRCVAHGDGAPVEVRPGWENIHIKRHAKDGKVRIVFCRRYDRERDTFTDVPPFALGIKE